MPLSPDDIVNYPFKQALRGYAIQEVDDLLDRIADQVERYEHDLDDLRQRLRDTEARLAAALETESTLKRTFVTAQQAAEAALDDARQHADELRTAAEREVTDQLERATAEADRLVALARDTADGVRAQARLDAEDAVTRIHDLRQHDERYREALLAQVDQQQQLLAATAAILRDEVPLPPVGPRPTDPGDTPAVDQRDAAPTGPFEQATEAPVADVADPDGHTPAPSPGPAGDLHVEPADAEVDGARALSELAAAHDWERRRDPGPPTAADVHPEPDRR